MNRNETLEMAERLINGDRADQYGDAFDTHERIGIMWSAILGLGYGSIRAVDVALCMDAVKTIRAVKNPQYEDSWVDKAGYSALGAEFGTREEA